jgi:cytochrome P450
MWVPTPLNLRTRRAIRRLDEAIRGLIAERRQRDTGARDFLGALLAARDEAGTGMTDQQLRDECVTMILAGHETTAVTLTWTLHCLSQHPQYAEDTSDGALRRVLDEAMRVYPPVWAIGRVTTEAFELGGSHLPAGTQLFLLPYLTHRDGETWASPLEFRPERWETDAKPPKGSFLPFGAGPRKCVGMHFAVHELTLLLRAVISRYRLAPSGEPVELQPSVTLRPRHGLKLRIERRPVDSTRRDPVS